jgi:nucleoid-associated protein YgaU
MRPPAKLIAAAAVLLAGAALALLFRKEAADEPAVAVEPLWRREPASPVVMEIAPPIPPAAQATVAPVAAEPAAAPSASELFMRDAAAPRIAAEYPAADGAEHVAAYRPAASSETTTASAQSIEHTIVDGDTLSLLAKRYLGDANRWREIFEANRQVLSDPELLPIDAELRIPPR